MPDGAPLGAARHCPRTSSSGCAQQAAAFGAGALSRAADIVNAGLTEMTGATAPRLQLELICARVLLPGAAGESGYAARLDRLERRLDVGGVPTAERAAAAARRPAARRPLRHRPGCRARRRPAAVRAAPDPRRRQPAAVHPAGAAPEPRCR